MTEEPHRWVEAVANRREYVENQLVGGSPIVAISSARGILLLTFGRDRRKLFEIYDRIAMGGIGHPGDLERLRLSAIELASQEGFSRSPADVSLQRLTLFALSPALKAAFEQIYQPPYLARLLFAELSEDPARDVYVALDYDGTLEASGLPPHRPSRHFAVLGAGKAAHDAMETFLLERTGQLPGDDQALALALEAWSIGRMVTRDREHPSVEEARESFRTLSEGLQLEMALLGRGKPALAATYRDLEAGSENLPEWA